MREELVVEWGEDGGSSLLDITERWILADVVIPGGNIRRWVRVVGRDGVVGHFDQPHGDANKPTTTHPFYWQFGIKIVYIQRKQISKA